MKIVEKSQKLGKTKRKKTERERERKENVGALFTSRVGIPFETLLYYPT